MYFGVIFILILYCILVRSKIQHNNYRLVFVIMSIICMIGLVWFKNNQMYYEFDLSSYETDFNLLNNISSFKEFLIPIVMGHEPAFCFLAWICTYLSSDSGVFFNVCGSIISIGYAYGAYKYSRNLLFSILWILISPTIFQQSFYVLRQHLASSLFMFALPLIGKGELKKYIAMVLLCSLFHYSALILFPVYFLRRINIKNILQPKFILFTILISVIFALGLRTLSSGSLERYQGYAESSSNTLPAIETIITSILLICVAKKQKLIYQSNSKRHLIVSYSLYGTIICLLSMGTSLGRLTNYFTFWLMASIPLSVVIFPKVMRFAYLSCWIIVVLLLNIAAHGIDSIFIWQPL